MFRWWMLPLHLKSLGSVDLLLTHVHQLRRQDLMKPSEMLRCTHVDDAKLPLSRKRFTINYPPTPTRASLSLQGIIHEEKSNG